MCKYVCVCKCVCYENNLPSHVLIDWICGTIKRNVFLHQQSDLIVIIAIVIIVKEMQHFFSFNCKILKKLYSNPELTIILPKGPFK